MSCYLETKPTEFPFGSDEIRFYHRFAPFNKLPQPSPLMYQTFIETTNFSKLTVFSVFFSFLFASLSNYFKVLPIVSNRLKL
jgi:hypothetical protein